MWDSSVVMLSGEGVGWAAARGESLWAALCTRRRKGGRAVQGFPSVEQLLRDMDEVGVARAVLDTILLDLEMPGAGGLKSIPGILAAAHGAKVMIVSSLAEEGAEA